MGTIFSILFGAVIGGFAVAKIAGFLMENSRNFYEYKSEKEKEFHNVSIQYHVAEAKNQIYEDMIVVQGREKQQAFDLVYKVLGAAIDKIQNPIPYYPQIQQTAQNTPYTPVSTQQADKNVDRGGGTDTIDLVLRGGVKEGEISLSAAGFNHNGYILPIPPKHAPVTEFGNTGVYLGSCLQCGTHFATKHSETKFCEDACKNEYHNLRR